MKISDTIEILLLHHPQGCNTNLAGIYLCKVNNGNSTKMSKICLKLTRKTQSDINDVVLVPLLLALNKFHKLFWCFSCFFEQVDASWK